MGMGKLRRLGVMLAGSFAMCGGVDAAEFCFRASFVVPATTEGLYLNLVSAVSGVTEGSVPGFDVDIYASANSIPADQLKFYWGSAANGGAGVVSVGDSYAVLTAGQVIGPDSLFSRAAFTGDTTVWQAGTSGYLGMRFLNESAGIINYGWLLLSTSAPLGFPATIDGWCYESSGAAITIRTPPLFANGFES
ncbi:MAG: hypothetical protein IPO66_17195 [Rhodanobacteraceae bacterium]|nr:hypothetical protein [Rhodanobacteraceae bacterium]